MPEWFKTWEGTGLIRHEDDNGDGLVQYVGAAAVDGEGQPIRNELTIDRDIMVLANPEIAGLPNWVIGLVAAGGLAAALPLLRGCCWSFRPHSPMICYASGSSPTSPIDRN